MSGTLNEVKLIGNLGADAEEKTLADGRKMLTLAIATSERWADKDTKAVRERTEWHRVVIFNQTFTKLAASLKRGRKLMVEGAIRHRSFKDPKDGSERWITEVVLDAYDGQLIFLDAKPKEPAEETPPHSWPPEAQQGAEEYGA